MERVAKVADSRILWLAGTLGLLQLLDGLMTYFFVSQGLAREINPFVAGIAGDVAFPFLKLSGALASVSLLWLVARRFPRMATCGAALGVVFNTAVVVWNLRILAGFW